MGMYPGGYEAERGDEEIGTFGPVVSLDLLEYYEYPL